jgi:hypothetical protein
MNDVSVVDTSALGRKRGVRGHPKGRPLDPQAVSEIRELLGRSPRQRDLLIEFLHRIQDRYGHISAAHILALAEEPSSRAPKSPKSPPSITIRRGERGGEHLLPRADADLGTRCPVR